MSRKSLLMVWIAVLTLISLACGSLQVGVVTPTSAMDSTLLTGAPTSGAEILPPTETIPAPTETPTEDFSDLWLEYRDPAYGYGIALPAYWKVNPTPTEGYDGAMTTHNYDEAYFMAHSTKGWWTDGIIPEGVTKMDFAGITDEHPELDLASAIQEMYNQSDTTIVLTTEAVIYNQHDAVLVTTASPNNLNETYTSVAFRLPNDKILLVTAYWGDAFSSPDVQIILNSIAFPGEPVILPKTAPQPPLSAIPAESETAAPESGTNTAKCNSGYFGTSEEVIETIQYNLEIGNYYPFSYLIGDPFVIGYWRSEGVSLPRAEAYAQLQENFFPAPDKVTFSLDPAQFPGLDGTPLEQIWGPQANVVAQLYSTGWGSEGQAETILAVARCSENGSDSYYWYGMLYAPNGFE